MNDAEVFYQHTLASQSHGVNSGIYNLWGEVPVRGPAHYYNLTAAGATHAGNTGVSQWYANFVAPTLGGQAPLIQTLQLDAQIDHVVATTTPSARAPARQRPGLAADRAGPPGRVLGNRRCRLDGSDLRRSRVNTLENRPAGRDHDRRGRTLDADYPSASRRPLSSRCHVLLPACASRRGFGHHPDGSRGRVCGREVVEFAVNLIGTRRTAALNSPKAPGLRPTAVALPGDLPPSAGRGGRSRRQRSGRLERSSDSEVSYRSPPPPAAWAAPACPAGSNRVPTLCLLARRRRRTCSSRGNRPVKEA